MAELEADCDLYLARFEKPASFILPGGTVGVAHLHLALTVVRRAERSVWAAVRAYGTEPGDARGRGGVNPVTATHQPALRPPLRARRLRELLSGGDVLWAPGGGREQAPDGSADRRPAPCRAGRRSAEGGAQRRVTSPRTGAPGRARARAAAASGPDTASWAHCSPVTTPSKSGVLGEAEVDPRLQVGEPLLVRREQAGEGGSTKE